MNKLQQLSSNLIGSEIEVKRLADLPNAKLLVISDSHGSSAIVSRIIEDFGKESDLLIFCGDGIGSILSVLDDSYNHSKTDLVIPPVFAFVQGNNDSDRYPVEFLPHGETNGKIYHEVAVPKNVELTVCAHKIFITHGHQFSVYYSTDMLERQAKKIGADLIFYGHTHIAKKTEGKSSLIVNPGSCALPRGGLPPSFATVEISKKSTDFDVTFYKIDIVGNSVLYEPFIPKAINNW